MKDIYVDVTILGTGTAGMAAYREVVKQIERVVLIAGSPLGTTCARVGCMPSNLLFTAADVARHASQFGISTDHVTVGDIAPCTACAGSVTALSVSLGRR